MNEKNGNQYRATRIWHEMIESFRTNVQLKRHWKNFRTYSDCFAANEAIDWLFSYLKTSHNFKSQASITRQQAIQLLQIFLKEKIIEDVRGDKYSTKEFQDDDRLYKFCTSDKHNIQYRKQALSPPATSTTTSTTTVTAETIRRASFGVTSTTSKIEASKMTILKEKNLNHQQQPTQQQKQQQQQPQQSQQQQQKQKLDQINESITVKSKSDDTKQTKSHHHHHNHQSTQHENPSNKEIWSKIAIESLHDLLKLDKKTQNLFETIQISSSNIQYNCTHVNKHGVVINVNKADDLPSWLMQAMTSLVHWNDFEKNEIKSQEHHHPSFIDVFNEVNKYFSDHKEPLLTKQLSVLYIKILRLLIFNYKQLEIDEFMKNLKAHLSNAANTNEFCCYTDNMFCGDDFTQSMQQNQGEHEHDHQMDVCCTHCLSTYDFVSNWLNCNSIEFNEFVVNLNANYRLLNHENEPYAYLDEEEEEYNDDDEDEVDDDLNSNDYCDGINDNEDNDCRRNARKLRRNNSFIAAINEYNPSNEDIQKMPKAQSLHYIKDHLMHNKLAKCQSHKRAPSFDEHSSSTRRPCMTSITNSSSLNNIALMQQQQQHQQNLQKMHLSVGALNTLISSVSIKDLKTTNSRSRALSQDNLLSFIDLDKLTYDQIIKSFRLCTLFLPPINKRKLHLLLRLLYKLKNSDHSKLLLPLKKQMAANNNCFNVDDEDDDGDNLCTIESIIETIIINSFKKSIISYDEKDECVANKIVQIFINNYSEIMKIPEDFIESVKQATLKTSSTYCSKISLEQYENEKHETSKQHLIKLLYNILTNTAMSQDDRLKRLKQFKEFYPDIYEEKYATIMKAINVLGLHETKPSSTNQPNKFNLAKKRSFNQNTTIFYRNSKAATNNLNTTNLIPSSSSSKMASSNATSLNFPKFLLPKTLKKVKL